MLQAKQSDNFDNADTATLETEIAERLGSALVATPDDSLNYTTYIPKDKEDGN